MDYELINIILGFGLGCLFTIVVEQFIKKWKEPMPDLAPLPPRPKGRRKTDARLIVKTEQMPMPNKKLVCKFCGNKKIRQIDGEDNKFFCFKCKQTFEA